MIFVTINFVLACTTLAQAVLARPIHSPSEAVDIRDVRDMSYTRSQPSHDDALVARMPGNLASRPSGQDEVNGQNPTALDQWETIIPIERYAIQPSAANPDEWDRVSLPPTPPLTPPQGFRPNPGRARNPPSRLPSGSAASTGGGAGQRTDSTPTNPSTSSSRAPGILRRSFQESPRAETSSRRLLEELYRRYDLEHVLDEMD